MNNTIRLVSEEGEELLLQEVMTIALEQNIGDLNKGDEIIIYKDEEGNYYPMIETEDEESLEVINDPNVIDIINDTLEVLEQNDEIL